MKKTKVFYLLSEAGRKDSILKGGTGKVLQEMVVDVTPEFLKLATVDENGNITLTVGFGFDSKGRVERYYAPAIRYEARGSTLLSRPELIKVKETVYFDSVQTFDELMKYEKDRLAGLELSKAQAEEALSLLLGEYEKKELQEKARKEELVKRQEQDRQKAIAEKERIDKERTSWILKHGSKYLKDCLELGVKANLEYVVERAALEFPEYTVDYADNASWEERFSPSEEALEELRRVRGLGAEADLVWLVREALVRDDDSMCDFEPCEAIVIKGYLGKFYLVKEF